MRLCGKERGRCRDVGNKRVTGYISFAEQLGLVARGEGGGEVESEGWLLF